MTKIIPFERIDPTLTQEERQRPPAPEANNQDVDFGPHATNRRQAPYYTTVYAGLPALDNLSAHQRLVYGYVRSWNENYRNCFASRATIAKTTGMNPSTVKRAIRSLEELGMLRVIRKPGRPSVLMARMNA